MSGTPVICFAGYSGSGKTTLLEQLLPLLSAKGLRVAVVKHDVHGLTVGQKDSHRFFSAGAACSVVNGPEATEVLLRQSISLEETLSRLPAVDLILIEGYKHCGYTRFGICRAANGKGFPDETDRFAALITDIAPDNPANRPVFDFSQTKELAEFIMSNLNTFTKYDPMPSVDAWLREAKADPSAKKIGMYLTHNGVVRETARRMVREGAEDTLPVVAVEFSYNQEKIDLAIQEALQLEGIYYARVWLNHGRVAVGESLMLVLIGGDIRPHVMAGLDFLVGKIKSECVVEKEYYQEA